MDEHTTDALLLRIFIGESDHYHHHALWEEILERARAAHLAGATGLRGGSGVVAGTEDEGRLLALRRGVAAATREDWNHAVVVTDRSLRLMDVAGAAPIVVSFYADLFATADLPS